jgi:hypothetical protein
MLALWMYGKCKGRRNHARNAMLATYTLVVSALVKVSAMWVDCTDDGTGTLRLDAAQGSECERGLGPFFSLFFLFVIPSLVLLFALHRKTKKVPCCCCCPCFDWIDKGETFSHAASYGWVTRKYKPSHQSFEVVSIAYKVVMVSTSSEYIYF